MELKIDNLIIGAGASGLLANTKLDQSNTIIIERGYKHNKTGDYVVFCKTENDFTKDSIDVITRNNSSGCRQYEFEYSEKVYNKQIKINQFSGSDEYVYSKGYPLDLEKLISLSNIYGNIEATRIDIKENILYGKILHLGKSVIIKYNNLINTIPIFQFAKLAGLDLLKNHNIFISYYPIGIKRNKLINKIDRMIIDYYSDPNIPYYRTQEYGNTKYYEYCINKKFDMKFDNIVIPGKFTEQNMKGFYDYMKMHNIEMIGRFALWDPSFLLDDIIEEK